jgi:hypothetical protein
MGIILSSPNIWKSYEWNTPIIYFTKMKKVIGISLIIAMLYVIVNICIDRVPNNYKIINANLQKIRFKGKTYDNYYLLTFDVVYCNYTYEFLKAPYPPGRNGSIDSLCFIKVLDKNGDDMTNKFSQDSIQRNKERSLYVIYPKHSDSIVIEAEVEKSVKNIINKINCNIDGNRMFRIETGRILKLRPTKMIPASLQVEFDSREIASKVENRLSTVYYAFD